MDTIHRGTASTCWPATPLVLALIFLGVAGCGGGAMESVTYTADNAPVVYRSVPDSVTVHSRSEVDTGPEIDGGRTALVRQIDYPSDAFDDGTEGQVRVSLVIGPDGRVYQPDILSSVGPSIDREALRVLQAVDWTPGRSGGQSVYVQTEIAVPFRLAEHQPAQDAPSPPQQQPPRPPRY
ncbi:hypothetical protein CRI93_08470 [Longimonas halophila]|uniref:TonB C-terminal domain-containing protein n=1 Tax=Longimonas halophila TaxID=1469170 RepID=A0A2H3NKY7_9BACT|nr:energy transducer TonB [Longimonas halophila]PEN06670.1 hypothetical protein CRI93_08470 [Longimonas halophila]